MSAVASREGHAIERWTPEQFVNVGQAVLNCVMVGSELFEVYDRPKKKFFVKNLGLSETGRRLVDDLTDQIKWMSPIFKPMLTEPKPWTSFHSGCYHDTKLASLVPMVRRVSPKQKEMIEAAFRSGSMDRITRALNAVQSTPFAINKPVLEQVKLAWERGDIVPKFPRKSKLRVPGKTKNWDELDSKQRKHVKKTKEKIILRNRALDADLVNMTTDLNIADDLAKHDRFYLPHNLDFRGRIYPIPTFNHQRADHIRALFQFARGKRLGPTGAYWLCINLANTGDFNKISKKSLNERIRWVNDNQRTLYLIGKKPGLTRQIWQQADKPFSFLAACVDFAGYVENGEDHISHIPPALDGANSGVQHYSAALRDEKGGATVNLLPQEQPADVYQIVADRVNEAINTDTSDEADLWKQYGVSRKVVKRNVMTFAYSSEKYGFRQQQMEDLMKPLEDDVLEGILTSHPFGDDNGSKAATFIASKVWDAVNDVVTKAAEGMRFIQKCAQLCAHEAKPLIWTSPIGLPVVHAYDQYNINRVRIFLYDKTIQPSEATQKSKVTDDGSVYNCIMVNLRTTPKGTLDKMKQRNAAAPNFIHSLDASHLMFTVLAGLDEGIEDFMLIHDSFATHAADTERFSYLIREQFVAMYEHFDVIQRLYNNTYAQLDDKSRMSLVEAPAKGELDLYDVLKSDYAFA
jgi:DNA-directed RNA polymerase